MSDAPILVLSEELVSKTRDVVERRKQIEELLEKTEDLMSEVNAGIYERVAADYTTRLAGVAAEYHPLRDEMISDLQSIRNAECGLRNALGEINDRLEEVRFRAKVGEFSEEELQQKEQESKGDASQLERQIATVEATFETANELLGTDIDKIAAAVDVEQQSKPDDEPESEPISDVADDGSRPLPMPPVENKLEDSESGSQNCMSDEPAVQAIHELAEEEQQEEPPLLEEVAREADSSFPASIVEDQMIPNAGSGSDTVFLNDFPAALSSVNDQNDDQLQTAVLICSKPAGNQWQVHAQGLVLGRSDSCDVMIGGRSVSRRHAIIQAADGNFFVEDVSSGGGVEVNSKRVENKQQLNSGDKIEVGTDVFVFEVQ